VQGGVAYLWIKNDGEPDEFQVSIEELRGVKITGAPVQMPYYAPWMGLMEAIPKREDFASRRSSHLITGASGTVIVATLRTWKRPAEHHLFQFWNADYMYGFFLADALDDTRPRVDIRIAVLSGASQPRLDTLLLQFDDGVLSWERVPN
jgi:hypothetical protein